MSLLVLENIKTISQAKKILLGNQLNKKLEVIQLLGMIIHKQTINTSHRQRDFSEKKKKEKRC